MKHWGARLGSDTYRGYNGYIITREGHSLLFGGDTAMTSAFDGYRVYGPFDAAIMPIGAYDPYIYNHCTPEQSVAMANAAGARLFVPIHHKTFQLSHERFNEPIERTEAALAQEADRLVVRDVGDTAPLGPLRWPAAGPRSGELRPPSSAQHHSGRGGFLGRLVRSLQDDGARIQEGGGDPRAPGTPGKTRYRGGPE